MPAPARQSTEAEIEALEALCERVAGFGHDISLEWLDGFLTALVASRRAVPTSEWMPAAFGDAFDRVFADPQDVQQATQALMARWSVLTSQLDPEALLDAPDEVRLSPLMLNYDDAARAEVVAAGHMAEDEARDLLQTGGLWAEGFHAAVEAFADDWPEPTDDEAEDAPWYEDCRTRVAALMLPQADLAEHLAEQYPGETLSRDQLVDEACFAVQDLRVYWLDHAVKPETRRVEAKPGRNDPCPCGSGKKYKKCHGAG